MLGKYDEKKIMDFDLISCSELFVFSLLLQSDRFFFTISNWSCSWLCMRISV